MIGEIPAHCKLMPALLGQGEQMLPGTTGLGGFPEMVMSALRPEGGL